MENQTDGLLVQRALRQFTPDVFQHPVWVRFAAANLTQITAHILPLLRAAKQLQTEGDLPGTCSLLFLCAALQAGLGNCSTALESIAQVLKLAKRHHLARVVMWGYWAASAVCTQMGAYAQSAGYLLQLQQELSRNNEWLLADLIELARQSLMECAEMGGLRYLPTASDRTGVLIEQMLCWGKPPPEIAAGAGPAVENEAEAGWKARSAVKSIETGIPAGEPGWRTFWQNLQRFVYGGKRVQPIETGGSNPGPAGPLYQVPVTAAAPGGTKPALEGLPAAAVLPEDAATSPGAGQYSQQASQLSYVPGEPAPSAGKDQGEVDSVETEPPASQAEIAPAPRVNTYLLGNFRVELEGSLFASLPSGRSRSVFAYLLANHAHLVTREAVMETFWPDTNLDSSRNNLNVAIYTLRHALKTMLDIPVILLHESAYQVNPDLQLWVDVEEFEQHVRYALQQETSGAIDEAVWEYKLAVSLYQGDFLADMPYEEWTTLRREQLRVLYLETLDHLSMIYFNQGAYDACTGLCQRILSQDACREDAHCRLMRCYARQGQAFLALRQYQVCVEALRAELDVPPSAATVQLYRQIKRQEGV